MRFLTSAVIATALTCLAAPCAARILHFDDLAGTGTLAQYGGLDWTGWQFADSVNAPYTAASGSTRLFNVSNDNGFGSTTPFTFHGARFAGYATVQFNLFYQHQLVGVSGALGTSDVPAFLGSGYSGLVDRVNISADLPQYFVMDDVSINGPGVSQVPEPGSLVLAGGALGVMVLLRRRRVAEGVENKAA